MNDSRIVPLLLRAIALLTALYCLVLVTSVLPLILTGQLRQYVASDSFGLPTILVNIVTLVVGPLAAINLFQLKTIGLRLTAGLFALSVIYYLTAVLTGRPALSQLVVNTASLILLVSPTARRACHP